MICKSVEKFEYLRNLILKDIFLVPLYQKINDLNLDNFFNILQLKNILLLFQNDNFLL